MNDFCIGKWKSLVDGNKHWAEKEKGGRRKEWNLALQLVACRHTIMGSKSKEIEWVMTHGGGYVKYNAYGNLFEVSSKYVPPIRPIGRGAYGLVWLVSYCPSFLSHFNNQYTKKHHTLLPQFFSVPLLIPIHTRKLPSRRLVTHLTTLLMLKGLWGKLNSFATWTMKM